MSQTPTLHAEAVAYETTEAAGSTATAALNKISWGAIFA